MAQALPAAAGDTSGPAVWAGANGDRDQLWDARSRGTRREARGPRRGNGPRAPRRLRRVPVARGHLRTQSSLEAKLAHTPGVGRGAGLLRVLSSPHIALRAPRQRRLRAAAGAGKFSPARRHFRQLHSLLS